MKETCLRYLSDNWVTLPTENHDKIMSSKVFCFYFLVPERHFVFSYTKNTTTSSKIGHSHTNFVWGQQPLMGRSSSVQGEVAGLQMVIMSSLLKVSQVVLYYSTGCNIFLKNIVIIWLFLIKVYPVIF